MTPQIGDKVVQGVACPKCEGRLCVFCDDLGLVPSDSDEGLVIAVLDDGFVRVWWMMRRQKTWEDPLGLLVLAFADAQTRDVARRLNF